jgi:hypothetical protein
MTTIIVVAIIVVLLLVFIELRGRNHPTSLMCRMLGKVWNQEKLTKVFEIREKEYQLDFCIDDRRVIRGILLNPPEKYSPDEKTLMDEPKYKKKDITHLVPGILICEKPIKAIRLIHKAKKRTSYLIEYPDNPLLLYHYMEDRRWSGSIAKKVGL